MLLYNPRVIQEIITEIRKDFKVNDNEYLTYQNIWHVANTVLREKFIAWNAILAVSFS